MNVLRMFVSSNIVYNIVKMFYLRSNGMFKNIFCLLLGMTMVACDGGGGGSSYSGESGGGGDSSYSSYSSSSGSGSGSGSGHTGVAFS